MAFFAERVSQMRRVIGTLYESTNANPFSIVSSGVRTDCTNLKRRFCGTLPEDRGYEDD
jgi:hypothetical protein